jgi:hypothetical protein
MTGKASESYFRNLKNDHIEICLRTPEFYLRASAPKEAIWELVETFEERAGVSVDGLERRPARKARPIDGQMSTDITEHLPEAQMDEFEADEAYNAAQKES